MNKRITIVSIQFDQYHRINAMIEEGWRIESSHLNGHETVFVMGLGEYQESTMEKAIEILARRVSEIQDLLFGKKN